MTLEKKKIILISVLLVLLVALIFGIFAYKGTLLASDQDVVAEEVEEEKELTPEEIAQQAEEARIQNIKSQLATGEYSPELKVAFLTFDDGPNDYSNQVLDILKQYGVKGTFFVNGKPSEYSESIYKRIVNEGHTLANHTFSHNYSLYRDQNAFLDDVTRLNTYLTEVTGQEPIKVFRFPGGSNNTNQSNVDALKNLGYSYYDWTSSAGDGGEAHLNAEQTWAKIVTEIEGQQAPVILMHAESAANEGSRGALPGLIEELQRQGYDIMTLDPSYKLNSSKFMD